MSSTKQVSNPTGKGGFGDNPQNRHNGAWKKEDTARYKLEQMMKLSESEISELAADALAPLFERKLARAIKNGQWREIEAMINQVYGRPKETVDHTVTTNPYESLTEEELRKLANGQDQDRG